jgi:D-glycero-alpha-D-manno-heptose-7-phosphate kinase
MAKYLTEPTLVMTRTPLRVSFAGGGTDLPDFYEQTSGAVLSTTINKYIYVTLKRHGDLFGEQYRLNYSDTEHSQTLEDVKNEIARECFRLIPVEPPLYLSTVGDLPACSGLGSSSSFAVGLLNALHTFRSERVSPSQLAEEASYIEMEVLRRPIGKQDHYAAAFGGCNFLGFLSDGNVSLEPTRLANGCLVKLFDHLQMFWTGMVRDASSVLTEQKSNTEARMDVLQTMRQQANELRLILQQDFDAVRFARVLDAGWQLKRQLASKISNARIDSWYERAKAAGALAGKICGAGGGGFLLFVVHPARKLAVRAALAELAEISVGSESHGSCVILTEYVPGTKEQRELRLSA